MQNPGSLSAVLAVLALALAACDSPADATSAHIIQVSIDSAAGPLIRSVTARLDVAADVDVTYSAPGTPVLSLRSAEPGTEHRFVLPRLRADRDYTVQVGVSGGRDDATLEFRTGSLPPEVAALEFEESGEPTDAVSVVEIVGGAFLGVVIVEDGEVVWYYRTTGSLFGTTRRANGELVLLDPTRGLLQVGFDGSVVYRLPQPDSAPGAPYGKIHHDVTVTPTNTLLFIANETEAISGVNVVGEALWEWNPESGTVTRRWSAFDYLDWNTERGSRSSASNWLHGNGLAYGSRDNVLLSMRNANLVASIAPDFSRVEWTLGGVNGSLQLDPAERFWGQHYISEPAPGRLLVYDNGFQRPEGKFTRVVEYSIDTVNKRATRVWQYRRTPDVYASLVGSARRLGNGNTVVLFGMKGGDSDSTGPLAAVEVDAAGQERWRLTAAAGITRLYRVTPVADLIGEQPGEFSR